MSLGSLPEELAEAILGMVPFPYIFKSRALSKSWLARLSPSSSQDEEELKSLAIGFQKCMAESFMKWKAFGPVLAGYEDFFAYDQESKSWLSIPTSSFIPSNLLINRSYDLRIEGALLLFVNPPMLTIDDYLEPGNLYVTNVLTRSWKQLPARPPVAPELGEHILEPCGPTTLVSHTDAYKVIEFYNDFWGPNQSFALIYNSKLSAWSWKTVMAPMPGGDDQGVHLHGVVYWLVNSISTLLIRNRGWELLTFNVEEETFQVLHMFPVTNIPAATYGGGHLLVCSGGLFMIVTNINARSMADQVIVVKIDPVSHTLVTVTEGGAATLAFGKLCLDKPPASQGDFIFLLGASCDKVLVYNTAQEDWSSFYISSNVRRSHSRKGCRWTPYSFQPGLNPLLEL